VTRRRAPRPALTAKQRQFVAEYQIDQNATQAAIRCGYRAKTAHVQGGRLYRNVAVRAAIRRALQQKLDKLDLTAEAVLQELARVGFANVQDHFTPRGDLVPLHKLSRAAAAGISGYEVILKNAAAGDDKIDRVLKVRQGEKIAALGLLAKHFALLVDRVQVSGVVTLGEKIAAARARGAALRAERAGPTAKG
jgi:phage terminase small subunit